MAMKHAEKYKDLLFMTISSLLLTLLIVATIYTARAVLSEVETHTPGNESVFQTLVKKHTGFGQSIEETTR